MNANAQNQTGKWVFDVNKDGVEVYARWRQELSDQFIAELKFVNTNDYKVDVTFEPLYTCPDGSEYNGGGNLITLKAGQEKHGDWAGLFDYPCKKTAPKKGGVKSITVKKID